jgi:DNA polymerase III sliding clamp (beta) subunit (PCNA family)
MEGGAASAAVSCDRTESAPFDIGFNGVYVAEALKSLGADQVTFAFSDPQSPTLLRDPAHEDRLIILMPLRV